VRASIRGTWERPVRSDRNARLWGIAALLALLAACSGGEAEHAADARDSAPLRASGADTPAPDPASTARWSYRLTGGWLSELEGYDREDPEADARDYPVEHRAECRGNASVQRCGTAQCWTWSVREVECSGKGSPDRLDWLNADSMSVRRTEQGWSLSPSLIGRGDCTPGMSFDETGELVRMTFNCAWKCSPGDPCEGGADYEFTRDTASPRPPPASGSPTRSRS
jgi:hypothetical protein